MAVMTYREALNLALREEMKRDERVFVIGEEVGLYEGAYKVTQGLLKEFGPQRIVDTPIAESGFTGVGIGAAMTGLRPVVEMMTFNFALLALDQIVNSAAKLNYMSVGQAVVRREGADVTVIAYMGMMYRALEAAEELEKDGISVEVVDPRTLQPLDAATILASVRKTHRAVVVEAGAGFAGMGSELSAVITEQAFDDLDAPVERVTGVPAPMPYARNLERAKTPNKERIVDAIRRICNVNGS